MSAAKQLNSRRRASVLLACVLLVATPVLASARLRATLWRATTGDDLTSQPSQSQLEVAATQALLARMRGINAFACELAMVAIDRSNWFGGLTEISNSPFVDTSSALLIPRELYSTTVIEPLWAALHDADACVRRTGASLFGRTRAPRAVERLRGALEDAQAEVRALAAFALGLAEDRAAAPRLEALLRDASPSVRASAAWALGEVEYTGAIAALADILVRDPSPAVRRAAARALGQIAG